MFDLKIEETLNGGDAVVQGNDLALVFGVENMPYMAMFGGNGVDGEDWWGNELLMDGVDDGMFRSETEALLHKVALNSGNLLLIEDAVRRDLAFLTRNIPGTVVNVTVQIVGADRLRIKGIAGGVEFDHLWNPKEVEQLPAPESDVPLKLWPSAITSGAYAICPFTLVSGATSVDFPERAFFTEADEILFLGELHDIALGAGMTGVFIKSEGDGFIEYLQGPEETWEKDAPVVMLEKFVKVLLETPEAHVAPSYWEFTYAGAGGYMVVNWGDGSDDEYHISPGVVSQTMYHTYFNGLTPYYVHIFHDGTLIQNLTFGYSAGTYSVIEVTGEFPASLSALHFINQKMKTITSLAISNLVNLDSLELVGSDVVSFSPRLFDIPGGVFDNLRLILLGSNKFSVATVDALFVDFCANNTPLASGYRPFYVNGQTPAAAPTSTSATERSTLAGDGWTIHTD